MTSKNNIRWGQPNSALHQEIQRHWSSICESNKTALVPNNDFQKRCKYIHAQLRSTGFLGADKKEKATIDHIRAIMVKPEFSVLFEDVSTI